MSEQTPGSTIDPGFKPGLEGVIALETTIAGPDPQREVDKGATISSGS